MFPRRYLTIGVAIQSLVLCACSSPTAVSKTPAGQFDMLWSTFDAEYSYFSYKQINWDSLRTVFRPRATAATSQEDLVAVLKELTVPLRDVHVRFTNPTGVSEPTYRPTAQVNWELGLWERNARACGLKQERPNLGYCLMDGVAYIVVGSWNDTQFARTDIDAVVDRYRDAPAMIIDVRMNSGGNDALAIALAERFTSTNVIAGYVRVRNGPGHDDFGPEVVRRVVPRGAFQFSRPVIVLSGRGVMSSNESFIAAMRELPNVTVVGDTSGGATGNPREHELARGWRYSVSSWIATTADRQVIEWRGIPPDVHIAWDVSAAAQGRDVVLEAALSLLEKGRRSNDTAPR